MDVAVDTGKSDLSFLERRSQLFLVGAGAVLGAASLLLYWLHGFSNLFVVLWLLSISVIGFGLLGREGASRRPFRFSRLDLRTLGVIVLLMAPLYLYRPYTIPHQMASDEMVMIGLSIDSLKASPQSALGPRSYIGFPELNLLIFGYAGRFLGGLDLVRMRFVHAFGGLLCICAAYLFFRQHLTRHLAVIATVILGINHSLLAISRVAMQHNPPLLFELLAFTVLVAALRSRSLWLMYGGGLLLGFGFYLYLTGRVVFVAWFVVLLALFITHTFPRALLIKSALVTGLAALLVATPMLISTIRAGSEGVDYPRQQLMIFKEGRDMQMAWGHQQTFPEAWRANARKGLLMFNSSLGDEGSIYWNPQYGFVDRLSGGMLWLGLFVTTFRSVRRRKAGLTFVLMAGAFFFCWMLAVLVVTKTPSYMRSLIMLPSIAYFATIGIHSLCMWARNLSGRKVAYQLGTVTLVSGVVLLNVLAFRQYVLVGFAIGCEYGSTVRYIADRAKLDSYRWILVQDEQRRYYTWSNEDDWRLWTDFAAGPAQTVEIVRSATFDPSSIKTPFTVLAHGEVAREIMERLQPTGAWTIIRNITPEGRLQAVEVIPGRSAGVTAAIGPPQ